MENLVAWKKKYRKIKKEFDAIKNYPDKLNYWRTNLCSKESIYWDFIPRYFIQGDEQERLLSENQVCIFPKHSNDKELFCDWVFNLIEEDHNLEKHSFNKLKLAFNETIGKTPLPKEFILSELKEIEYQRDKGQKSFENKLHISTWAYYYGYKSVVKGKKLWIDMDSELFFTWALNISNGVADAYYYSFLQNELEKLELKKYRNIKIEVKNDVDTFELEKCIYLMGFWFNEDSKVINEFLNKEIDIDKKYVAPFVDELNKNLLRKDTHEAKRDLIKYYIFQFIEIQGFLDIHKSIIQHKPDSKGDSHQRNTSEVKTDFEKYVIICSQYFDVFFNVIQLCCKNYNIDFFKACLELNFTLEFIDSGISLMIEDERNENSLSQQAETKSTSNRSIVADIVDSLRAEVEMDELLLRADKIRNEKEGLKLSQQKTIELKPVFKPEAVQIVFDIIKDFFSPEHQEQLKLILNTGENAIEPLIFKDNGNRLANAFKQLKEKDFITGVEKKQLENWITQNFKFINRKQVKTFTPDYIEKCISRNFYHCKKTLFSIENGEIKENT